MALLYSTLRRSCSSLLLPLAINAAGSSRTLLIGTFSSTAPPPQSAKLSQRWSSVLIPSLHFSTAAISKKQTSNDDTHLLLQIIDSEIKFAQDSDIHDCVVDAPVGFPFDIKDNPGERIILLKRECDDEIIKVEVDMPDTENAEDRDDNNNDDESKVQPSIPLTVSVSKNGACLQFGVRAFPDEISIHSLSLNEEESSEDQLAYQGPQFSDLDENLQKAFHKYLEIRGLRPSTANFLLEYMICKDSKEYLQWLKNLKKFVQSQKISLFPAS